MRHKLKIQIETVVCHSYLFLVIKYCLLLFIYIIYISIITFNTYMCVLCQSQPINNQCCGWIGPCDYCYNGKIPFNINHQETLEKQRLITYMTWKLHSVHLESHSEVARRERESACMSLEFHFY